ncbi:hypothetical protein BCH308197_3674 [Bacillus cereus H3081.97]|uniref:hypothetical protein n=1 Tax=Bacillus cereus group TaxID=86661 RepID=UPI00016B72B0|nr:MULTISPECIES: hypothetical protein [Bacillus cereus group]EDZ56991.1 hypothetical protein BCH308197_3674 [Bacillus cereus H3081.97]KLA04199.1 hypothetical protein B4086_3543 [Bacillus cereus]KXI69391.1 hypothetical protein ACS51_12685 [Bacillus cereus]MCC2431337.1 hypothetical protein [Bacillus paranthracis]MDX5913872.1 hypothetical protein [Bacillus cereus group sp. BfR-BA-01026]
MVSLDFIRQLRSLGLDEKNLSSSDLGKLLAMSVKGEFDIEVFKNFLNESNIGLKTLLDGFSNFANLHKFSSDEYILTLKMLIIDFKEQAKNSKTKEERDEYLDRLFILVDKMKEETNANREHGTNFALAAAGVAVAAAGAAVFLVTRNPEVLKKGTTMFVKHALK